MPNCGNTFSNFILSFFEDVEIRLLPPTTTRNKSSLKPIEKQDDVFIPLPRVHLDATYDDIQEIAGREFFSNNLEGELISLKSFMLLICVDVKLIYSSQNDLVPLPQKQWRRRIQHWPLYKVATQNKASEVFCCYFYASVNTLYL